MSFYISNMCESAVPYRFTSEAPEPVRVSEAPGEREHDERERRRGSLCAAARELLDVARRAQAEGRHALPQRSADDELVCR